MGKWAGRPRMPGKYAGVLVLAGICLIFIFGLKFNRLKEEAARNESGRNFRAVVTAVEHGSCVHSGRRFSTNYNVETRCVRIDADVYMEPEKVLHESAVQEEDSAPPDVAPGDRVYAVYTQNMGLRVNFVSMQGPGLFSELNLSAAGLAAGVLLILAAMLFREEEPDPPAQDQEQEAGMPPPDGHQG